MTCDYGEDLWTRKLRHGLQYMGIEYELMRGNTEKAWGKRCLTKLETALLFNGAPDIIITHRNEGVIYLY